MDRKEEWQKADMGKVQKMSDLLEKIMKTHAEINLLVLQTQKQQLDPWMKLAEYQSQTFEKES